MARSNKSVEEQLRSAKFKVFDLEQERVWERVKRVANRVYDICSSTLLARYRDEEESAEFPGEGPLKADITKSFEDLEAAVIKYESALKADEDRVDAEETALREKGETAGRLIPEDAQ